MTIRWRGKVFIEMTSADECQAVDHSLRTVVVKPVCFYTPDSDEHAWF